MSDDTQLSDIIANLVNESEIVEPLEEGYELEETRIALSILFYEVITESQLDRCEVSTIYDGSVDNSILEYPFLKTTAIFLRDNSLKMKWLRMLQGEEK